jgi:hypothetical protein
VCNLYHVRFVTFCTVAFALTGAGPDSNAHSDTDTIPRSNASTNSSSDTDAFTRSYICVDGHCARCGHEEFDQQR